VERSASESPVAAAIWRWRHRDEDRRPESGAALRRRAVVESAVGAGAGLALMLGFHCRTAGAVALCIALAVLLSGLFAPAAYRALKRGAVLLGRGVGVAMSWLLLAPFFYICFSFGRLILVICGKDPLRRRCPSPEPTYWLPRGRVTGPEHYRRQF
jgi:hypothetical protein